MSPADKAIIKANPNVSAYDLLTKHGLSQGGYNELVAKANENANATLKPTQPRPASSAPPTLTAQPILTPMSQYTGSSEKVTLRAKNSVGNGMEVSRERAESMMRRYPGQYQIV